VGSGVKVTNADAPGVKAVRAVRGMVSTQAAGAKGMVWRDASSESIGQIRDMTVYGAEFVDHEDGTGDLIIGGPGGEGPGPGGGSNGDGTGAASVAIYMVNNSGENLDQGAVVVVDDTLDNAVTTTASASDTQIVGVLMEPIAADAIGPVLFNGYAVGVNVTGTVLRGDYLETSTSAGLAQASATREAGTFGVVVAAPDITDFIADYAVTEEDTAVTSLPITMPAAVSDTDSAGQTLFLALWRDTSVTSNPTITGWTRIGATSGFWYYYRVCTVNDTATATWTTASPAAAIVALLDPVVALVEDFDYDATTAGASITGLDDNPRYAIAALQGSEPLPDGWSHLLTASVAYDPGGVTDLALSGTVTNDPANTLDWDDPTFVNDGNESTYAEFPPHSAGETFRLKLDLGVAGVVSEAWIRTAYAMDLQYSTDDITYVSPPSVNWAATTTHNGFPTYRRVTWTGGDITARYWRLGRTAAGMGSGETISTWEMTGEYTLAAEGMVVGQYIGRASSVTSPFTGSGNELDGLFAFNLNVEPKASAILYGPDLTEGDTPGETLLTNSTGERHVLISSVAAGATETLDLGAANTFDLTLTANCTLTLTNPPATGTEGRWTIVLRQGGSGSYTVTWPGTVVWRDTDGTATATPPTLATAVGAVDTIDIRTVDGGASYGASLENGSGAGGTASPLTTKGDLWGYDTADARVPVGTNGYLLVADSTDAQGVVWENPETTGHYEVLMDGSGTAAPLEDGSGADWLYVWVP
jgi:hypothetical protein